jgi:hypothetical protein
MNLTTAERKRVFDRISIGGLDACWLWTGYKTRHGYGKMRFRKRGYWAHRFMYELLRGPIADGLLCHHVCENPSCVNPKHLALLTPREHSEAHEHRSARKAARARGERTHCPHGHPFDEANTRWTKDGHGRRCRACGVIYTRTHRQKVSK